jgi:hypothetical protein
MSTLAKVLGGAKAACENFWDVRDADKEIVVALDTQDVEIVIKKISGGVYPKLKHLTIRNGVKIEDVSFLSKCSNLESASITFPSKIDVRQAAEAFKKVASLQSLQLNHFNAFSQKDVEWFSSQGVICQSIYSLPSDGELEDMQEAIETGSPYKLVEGFLLARKV